MSNVIELVTRKDKVHDDVVDMLKSWLGFAERGEIVNLAIVGVAPDGAALNAFIPGDEAMGLLGGLTMVTHHICTDRADRTEKVDTDPSA